MKERTAATMRWWLVAALVISAASCGGSKKPTPQLKDVRLTSLIWSPALDVEKHCAEEDRSAGEWLCEERDLTRHCRRWSVELIKDMPSAPGNKIVRRTPWWCVIPHSDAALALQRSDGVRTLEQKYADGDLMARASAFLWRMRAKSGEPPDLRQFAPIDDK